MLGSRKLVLRKETLTELTNHELRGIAGAADGRPTMDNCRTKQSCVTCVDPLTIATCECPAVTGPTCFCPTAGC